MILIEYKNQHIQLYKIVRKNRKKTAFGNFGLQALY